MDRESRNRWRASVARRKRVLDRSTLSARSERIAAQMPSEKGALAAVHAGQSPMSPIPIGRATTSNIKTSRTVSRTFTCSAYRRCGLS